MLNCRPGQTWHRWSSLPWHWRQCANSSEKLGDWQRKAQRAGVQTTMTCTRQVDPRVMNKCPTFSGRDTEWSERSFIFESVAAMANLEPAMEGAFTGSAEEPVAELTLEMKLSAKQLYCLLVKNSQWKSVDSRQKRRKASRQRSMETYQDRVPARRSWAAHSNAHGNHATWLGFSRCGKHVLGPID